MKKTIGLAVLMLTAVAAFAAPAAREECYNPAYARTETVVVPRRETVAVRQDNHRRDNRFEGRRDVRVVKKDGYRR